MEILFGNKGIYHYMDTKVGTMQELEEHGRMYQVRMLVENELPYILPSSMICTDAEVWLSHNTKDCYGLQAYLQQKTMNGTQLKKVLNQIMQQADALEAYLLDASDLVIRVEYLFMQKEKNEIRMLCVPGYQKPLKEQLTAFLEYLMPRFSHEDRAGELFLYECHRVLTDEWSDMTDFLALLNAGTDTDGRCRKQGEKTSMQKPNSSEENEFAEEAVTLEQKVARADIDAIFSKRFLLYALAGGAALALIIKYLFFDGTTGTAIFGIVWLLTLIILAIMTARDKEDGQESESAMQEYGRQVQGDETLEDAPVQGYSRQAEQAVHSVDVPMGLSEKSVQDSRIPDMKLVPLTNGALESFRIPMDKASFTIGRDKASDYRVATTQISRVHVRLFCRPDGLYIEDQNSTNGTYINTKRIPAMTEQKLEKGDVVGLANEEFFVA